MDRSRRKRRNRKRKPIQRKDRPKVEEKQGYDEIIKENAKFEQYYKTQGIVKESEWEMFMGALRENLPVSFRITGSKNHAKALLEIIQSEYFDQLVNVYDDRAKPICLPWYPENLAWQLNLSRKLIRKDEVFTKLHNFLVYETNSGNISRQEVVSMIPPLLLDVQPHHRVLDMCAAPGSKTAQLIEMLHGNDTALPEGIIVANDVDNKRCYMLVHQAKRLQSPSFVITNHDASAMPNIRVTESDGEVYHMKYDRILCDVPCSGDGTLRKNYDVWKKWNVANGNNLHGLQWRIAKRGLELLNVGGRLVYSTCSFNPIENEAVVHNLLVQCEGSVELVDVSNSLPGLKFSPGISYWKLLTRDLESFTSPEDVPESHRTQIRPHMFPPKPEDAEKFHLDRCIRILPHHQNTGGFFVAVLKKIALLPGEKIKKIKDTTLLEENLETLPSSTTDSHPVETDEITEKKCSSPPRKKVKVYGFREDPFFFFKDDTTIWPSIQKFYGIDSSFDSNCLLTRCETGKKRNIYLVTKIVRDIISNNEDRIKVINTGVKIFCRSDSKGITSCNFRLTQEGLQTVLPFISSRRVTITKDDLVLLLTTDFPFNNKMSQSTREQLNLLDTGCIILLYQLKKNNDTSLTIALCGWKGATSTRAYVPKGDRVHYLRLCGADVSKYERRQIKSEINEDEDEVDNVDVDQQNDVESVKEEIKEEFDKME